MESNIISRTSYVCTGPLWEPEAQELVTSLIESAGTAIFILEKERLQYVNEPFEEVSGYSAREIVGTSIFDIVHPDDKEAVRTHLAETLKGAEVHRPHVHRLIKKNREVLWILGKTASAQYRGKKTIIGCFIDISQSKQAEEELKHTGERLEILFEFAPDAYYLSDIKGTFIDGNRAAEDLTGYKRKELIGKSFMKLKLLPPEQLPRAARLLAKNALGYSTGPDEFILNRKNGDPATVEIRTYPVNIEGKAQVLGIARDISERKRVEQELQKHMHALGERVKELNFLYEISKLKTTTGLSLPVILQKIVRLIPPVWQYPEHTCARITIDDQIYTSKNFKETNIKQTANFSTGENQRGVIEVFYRGKKQAGNTGSFLAEEAQLLTILARNLEDIVAHKNAERAVKEVEEKFEAISLSAQDAIIITDSNGYITYWNKASEKIFGYTKEEATGKDLHALIAPTHDYQSARKALTVFKRTGKGNAIGETLEMVGIKKGGMEFPVELSLSSIEIKGQWHAIGIVRDITRRKRAEDKLAYLASHDPLTGLPNRTLFNDRMDMALSGAQRTGQQLAVLVIDMDRFKHVNDTLGHNTGDQLLQAVGKRLTDTLRKSDTVARMGGDEFFILAAISDKPYAGRIARKILKAFQEPFELDGNMISITLSIGVALYPEDGEDAQTLEKKADAAMYHVKESGRNRYHIYSPDVLLLVS